MIKQIKLKFWRWYYKNNHGPFSLEAFELRRKRLHPNQAEFINKKTWEELFK